LARAGWRITDDPYVLEYEDAQLKVDLGAERVLAASDGNRNIVVEIKTFSGKSFFNDLHRATGQYCAYRIFLEELEPAFEVWMAVSWEVYQNNFLRPSTAKIIERLKINLLVFDTEIEEVIEWIRP
jgi:XisH protein